MGNSLKGLFDIATKKQKIFYSILFVLTLPLTLSLIGVITILSIGNFGFVTLIIMSCLLLQALIKKDAKKLKRRAALLLIVCACLAFSNEVAPIDESAEARGVIDFTSPETTIHFLSTGNSDSILLENNGLYALIDAGDWSDSYLIPQYLKEMGVKKLDYLILTHFHADHLGSAPAILRNFEVGTTFTPNGDYHTPAYKMTVNALANNNINVSVPLEAMEIPFGTSTLTFYNTRGDYEKTNNNSLVTLLTNGYDRLLFMGDAEKEVEAALNIGKVDLVKIGHHGSSTSSTPDFIQKIDPDFAVITVGKNNDYGHPHQQTMTTLEILDIPVFRTDELGHIIFRSSGNGLFSNKPPGTYNPGIKK